MKSFVLNFSQFVNENWQANMDNGLPYLCLLYKPELSDFDFEKEALGKLEQLETIWSNLKNEYHWNTKGTEYNNNHFLINVKVHAYPELDEIRRILKIPELSDDEASQIWNEWFRAKAEAFVDSINFEWVKHAGYYGRGGGWLLLSAGEKSKEDDLSSALEDEITGYLTVKKRVPKEKIELVKPYLASGDWNNLKEIGLAKEFELVTALKEVCDYLIEAIDDKREIVDTIKSQLDELQTRVNNFRRNCLKEFYEYLANEYLA